MRKISPYLSHPISICAICILAFMGAVIFFQFVTQKSLLTSPPSTVRPWAEADFLRLTKPTSSPGKATDPQYLASHSGSTPSTNPDWTVDVVVHPPAADFVPSYEVIEFDMQDGFSADSRSSEIRWIAATPYDLPADTDQEAKTPYFTPRHPDGNLMSESDVKAINFGRHDLKTRGYQFHGHFGSATKGFLELKGFENYQCELQGVFDANTHVALSDSRGYGTQDNGLIFNSSLTVLHDTPLLAVFDLAHGKTEDFTIPAAKGAKVSEAGFSVEIIDMIEGSVGSASTDLGKDGRKIEVAYGSDRSAKSFSVIYQINPPSMTDAVTLDAIDAAGNLFESSRKFMDDAAPVSGYACPLAMAKSFKVRYRPHQTRLIMKMKSLPGVTSPNIGPTDLFDVKAPQVTFRDSFAMRRFIAAGTQLKDITGSLSPDPPAAFPMTLTHVTPRQVAEKYLALSYDRSIKIDPAALTVEFEQPRNPNWFAKTWIWIKSLL